jgi:hypothetical protein
MLPSFIVIGAMKSGTSSLFHYIASHPNIVNSSKKETNFFKTPENFSQGINWYESFFKGSGKYAFEASPMYTTRPMNSGVPERMYSILPNIKLIYLLRDPIERIVSHYINDYAYRGQSLSFSEAIRTDNKYVLTSKYYFQIQAYLEYFSEKQILIIESEKLRKNPGKVMSDVFAFLGISDEYDGKADILEKKFNKSSSKYRVSLIEQELRKKTNNRYLKIMIGKMCKPFSEKIARPVLSSVEREMLCAELAPDVEKLRQFTGMSFSDWSV